MSSESVIAGVSIKDILATVAAATKEERAELAQLLVGAKPAKKEKAKEQKENAEREMKEAEEKKKEAEEEMKKKLLALGGKKERPCPEQLAA